MVFADVEDKDVGLMPASAFSEIGMVGGGCIGTQTRVEVEGIGMGLVGPRSLSFSPSNGVLVVESRQRWFFKELLVVISRFALGNLK